MCSACHLLCVGGEGGEVVAATTCTNLPLTHLLLLLLLPLRTDLLPFYSRLVGTLHPLLPDIAPELVTLLVRDLKYHVRPLMVAIKYVVN